MRRQDRSPAVPLCPGASPRSCSPTSTGPQRAGRGAIDSLPRLDELLALEHVALDHLVAEDLRDLLRRDLHAGGIRRSSRRTTSTTASESKTTPRIELARRARDADLAESARVRADPPLNFEISRQFLSSDQSAQVQYVAVLNPGADELARLTDSPIVRLDRAVAEGEAAGPRAGLAALAAAVRRGGPVDAQPRRARSLTRQAARLDARAIGVDRPPRSHFTPRQSGSSRRTSVRSCHERTR